LPAQFHAALRYSVQLVVMRLLPGALIWCPMDKLFRLSKGMPHDPAIDKWFDLHQDELGLIAQQWFGEMRASGDDVMELMHDGFPVACVADIPFGYVNVFTAHINVGFFLGALLNDPEHLLQGTGKRMRHVKVRPNSTFDQKALRQLINHSYADVKGRL